MRKRILTLLGWGKVLAAGENLEGEEFKVYPKGDKVFVLWLSLFVASVISIKTAVDWLI